MVDKPDNNIKEIGFSTTSNTVMFSIQVLLVIVATSTW